MNDEEKRKLRAAFDARVDALWDVVGAGEMTVGEAAKQTITIWNEIDDATYEELWPVTDADRKIAYADWEDVPVMLDGIGEAWFYSDRDGKWHECDYIEASHKAYLASAQTFRGMFGELPPLPARALAASRTASS
jgi:hypothetical protein